MLYIVFTVILCFLILILFLNIRLGIKYVGIGENQNFTLNISLVKTIFKIEIPFIDTEKKYHQWGFLFKKRTKQRKIGDNQKEQKEFISFEKIKDVSEKAYDTFQKYLDVLIAFNRYMKKKIKCENFSLKMNYGLGDAALTGISAGMLWGVIYSLLGVLDRYFEFLEMDVAINPDFNDIKLQMEFNCIFKIKIVHIIIVILIVLYTFIKSLLVKKDNPQNFVAG